MEFTELDKQFEETWERLQRQKPIAGVYGKDPLAEDHFLLKRSWDYFRQRVRNIEDQWRKIAESKDAQLLALKKEVAVIRERMQESEEETRLLRAMDRTLAEARKHDIIHFAGKKDQLQLRWDAERDALARKIEELEFQIKRLEKDSATKLQLAKKRETDLAEAINRLKQEAGSSAEKERENQKRWSEHASTKDEQINMLDMKTDAMRNELARRDQAIKELREAVLNHEKDAVALTAYVAELQKMLRDKDQDLHHEQERLQILSLEKENLRRGWENERAEWRELWDRGRSHFGPGR
jgi:chromosome segregation ATPase